MELHLNNPDLQAQIERRTAETGRPADELAEDAIASYLADRAAVRHTLDSRYDDLKSGRARPVSGEELRACVLEKLRARTARST